MLQSVWRYACFRSWLPGVVMLALVGSTSAEPQRYALVVGVREFPASDKLTPLAFTEPDAETIAGTLTASGFRVTLMTQAAARPQGQQKFNPTAAFIRRQFEGLIGTPYLKNDDCLVVVLEGHGIQLPAKTDPEKQAYFFCPADALVDDLKYAEDVQPSHNLIPVLELYETLKKSSAGVKLLVVDACRNDPNKIDNFRAANSVTRPPVPAPPGGIAALFSCSEGQRAAEDPALKHGVFSYFLIEGLGGKADLDGDKQINVSELYNYVGNRTYTHVWEKYSTRQLPEFQGEIKGWAPLVRLKGSTEIPTPPGIVEPQADEFAGTTAGDLWDKNSLTMNFRWCPPGVFTMGSPATEKDRKPNETQVQVTLSRGFWLGQYEVTQGEFRQVMRANPSYFTGPKGQTGLNDHPVESVTWAEALEFCRKLTEQDHAKQTLPTGWKYTLPTEAQWEYASRTGSVKTASAFGDSLGSTQANFDGDSPYGGAAPGPTQGGTIRVGSYPANGWKLHDMHGNVHEWCLDWYADQLPGGKDPVVLVQGQFRLSRGGCWFQVGRNCRFAYRNRNLPDSRNYYTGFRVAAVPVP